MVHPSQVTSCPRRTAEADGDSECALDYGCVAEAGLRAGLVLINWYLNKYLQGFTGSPSIVATGSAVSKLANELCTLTAHVMGGFLPEMRTERS